MRYLSWLPPLLWLVAAGVAVWFAVQIIPATPMPDQLLGWLFLAVGVWCLWMCRRELRAARHDAPPPRGAPTRPARPMPPEYAPSAPERRLPDTEPLHYPLAPDLRSQLLSVVNLLQQADILQSGEVTDAAVIECAEYTDAFAEIDLPLTLVILGMLAEQRARPWARLAFFTDQVEVSRGDPIAMIAELARISGYRDVPRQVRFELSGDALPGGILNPPANAVLEFELEDRRHTVTFTFYAKYLPGGLIEQAVLILTPPDAVRRFFTAEYSDHPVIAYAEPGSVAKVNAALGPQPAWVPV